MSHKKSNSVLVTGGRGFVGRAVHQLLRNAGERVISLDNSPITKSSTSAETSSEVVCDISDSAQLQQLFEAEQIGGIIHLAAMLPTVAQRDPARATRVNVQGSFNLLEMARMFGVRCFVFGGSVSVYGTRDTDQLVSERDPAAPGDLYGAAKLYVERLGEAYRDCNRIEFVSLRIGRVLGPGAHSATSAWRSQIFEFLDASDSSEIEVPYIGTERLLVVHVEDVGQMLVQILHAPQLAHAVYNAVCESMVVADLKREVEALNPNIRVMLGDGPVTGNPRLLDSNRFAREFPFQIVPLSERLRRARSR